jgi:APA family basic amino acid/polyamine antiporter
MGTDQSEKASVKPPTFGGLFRIKPLDAILRDAQEPEHKLNRALGPLQLTLFGVGAIIGAGIFSTVGTAAAGEVGVRLGAGPALILSFIITAVACGFTALCYAEFAAMVPISGSAYTYSYATLGEAVAWIIGWDLIIEYAVGNVAVAISWAGYVKRFLAGFNINLPDFLTTDYRTAAKVVDEAGVATIYESAPKIFDIPIIFNLPAVLIVALITLVLVWGIKESARFNAVMVVVKIVVLIIFVIAGFTWINPDNWSPFAPNGFRGISAGAAIIFFAYIGFDAVSTVAEETKNPQRDLPIGIIASLIICTVFYALVSLVFTGLISYEDMVAKPATERSEPLTMALTHAQSGADWLIGVVAFGAIISTTAVLLVFQLGQPRIFMSMSRDGLLPAVFRRVHEKFRTPHIATMLTGLFVAVFAAVANLDEVVDLTNIGTLFAFIVVCAGIMILRVKEPDRPRSFKVPGGHVIPVLGIISCLYLIYFLPTTSWLRFAAWLNIGFVIYVGYGSVRSRLTGEEGSVDASEHASRTAFTGAIMGLLGTLLLFFMHATGLWLGALRDGASMGEAAGNIFSAANWLEKDWFMIAPLALNAAALFPTVVIRALRGKGKQAQMSIAIAAVVGVLIVVYLLMVFTRAQV